jgi:hypothetical protein
MVKQVVRMIKKSVWSEKEKELVEDINMGVCPSMHYKAKLDQLRECWDWHDKRINEIKGNMNEELKSWLYPKILKNIIKKVFNEKKKGKK